MSLWFIWCRRFAPLVVIVCVGLAGFLAPQVSQLRFSVSADSLLSQSGPEWEAYSEMRDQFGSDEVAAVYLRDPRLFTPEKLAAFAALDRRVRQISGIQRVESLFSVPLIRGTPGRLQTGPLIHPDDLPATPNEAEERRRLALENPLLTRRLISGDGLSTLITLYLEPSPADMDPGLRNRQVYQELQGILKEFSYEFASLFQIGGPVIQETMIGFILADQKVLLPAASVFILLLLGLFLRAPAGSLLPLLNALLATIWVMGALAVLQIPVSLLSSMLPVLILIIGSTEDVHILEEYRRACLEGLNAKQAVAAVGRRIGLTLILTGLTTCLGFASAALSDLSILREFGLTAGLAMLGRLILSLTLSPALVSFFQRPPALLPPPVSSSRSAFPATPLGPSGVYSDWLFATILPHRLKLAAALAFVCLLSFFFARRLHVGNDLVNFLPEDTPIRAELRQASRDLAGTKLIYLTLRGAPGEFRQPQGLRLIEEISGRLRDTGKFDTVTSLADYVALLHRELRGGHLDQFRIPDDPNLIAQLLLLPGPASLAPYISADYSLANIHLRCSIEDSRTFVALYKNIRYRLGSGEFGPVRFVLTGKSILVADSVNEIIRGQAASVGVVATLLFCCIAVIFVSARAGLLALAANLLPVALLFGLMGAAGISLNVGTCMIAAVAIGIAVDNTLHLMVRYNLELKRSRDEKAALRATLLAEFSPMIIATFALTGGFIILGFSSFVPVRQFGLLSAFVMIVALFADLILTPVLLSLTRLITVWDVLGLKVRRQLMERASLFEGLNESQVKRLILTASLKEIEAGHVLIHEGEVGNTMFVLIEGRLEVLRGQGASRTRLAELHPGDVLGEIALVSRSRRTADVVAAAPSRLLALDWDALLSLQRFAPFLSSRFFLNLSRILGQRLVNSMGKLDTMTPFLPPNLRQPPGSGPATPS